MKEEIFHKHVSAVLSNLHALEVRYCIICNEYLLLECFFGWVEVTSWYASFVDGGPIYAMAKFHDQEILRALVTHANVYHGELELNLVWSPTFMCSVKTCD